MKVLFLTEYFYPDKTSTPKVLTELAEDIIEEGIDVEVITSRKTYKLDKQNLSKAENYRNINIVRVFSSNFNRDNFLGRIINYFTFLFSCFISTIFRKDYDCMVIVSNPPILPLVGYISSKLRKKKYIYLLHDVYPDIAVKVGVIKENGFIFKIMNIINNLIYKSSYKIIVLGRDMKQNLLNKGVDKSKIEIITNWADKRKIYNVNKKNEFSILNKIDTTFNIIYTGNIGRFHDVDTILNVAKELSNYIDCKFIFVGDGYKRRHIEEEIQSKYMKNIIIIDYQYDDMYNNVLNSADLFITTIDKGIEGLGVPSKTYSYMAVGKPIIAIMSKESEIGNLVEDNKLGIRVDPGEYLQIVDFILNIKNNKIMYNKICNNVKELFKKSYEREIVTSKFIDLIRGV